MIRFWRYIMPLVTAGILVPAMACRAQVTITSSIALTGGLYQYRYAITNTSATDDLFDISIHVTPGAGTVQNIVAAPGFQSAYDTGLGLVDFLEDTGSFTSGVAVSGFGFDSKYSPANGIADADFLSAASGNIVTVTARTLTPTGAVPEPGAWALLGAGTVVAGGMAANKRGTRRRSAGKLSKGAK